MQFMEMREELKKSGGDELNTYDGYILALNSMLEKEGWQLVHYSDATIGINRIGEDNSWVRVYPGPDVEYGKEVVRFMLADKHVGVDEGKELYALVTVNTDFPFVVEDPSSCVSHELESFFGNEYPEEYITKVFDPTYYHSINEIVNTVTSLLKEMDKSKHKGE